MVSALTDILAHCRATSQTEREKGTYFEEPIRDLLHSNTGQVIMRVTPIPTARLYEPQSALIGPGGTPGPWVSAGLFSNSRSMPLNGLTPGAEYLFRVRALGGSTGSSDWSDTRSHRSL